MVKCVASCLFIILFFLLDGAFGHTGRPVALAQTTGRTAVPRIRIGVDPSPKASSDFKREAKAEAVRLMRSTPANHFHYAKVWNEIEQVQGVYDTEEIQFLVKATAPLSIAFNLRVLTAGVRNMPGAYQQLAWDSPQMIDRLGRVIDAIAPVLGRRVWSYGVGNEIDTYFASRPQEIAEYARMLRQIKPRIRALHPDAMFTASFQSEAAPQLRTLYAPIVAELDSVSFMYYPLTSDFVVRPPSVVPGDLKALVDAAAPRPVFLQEVGYPTSALLGSSPEAQAEFVRRVFETIRELGSSRVLGATYLFQGDFPEFVVAMVAEAYGAPNDRRFREYIATLGLRDERDRPKPAWNEFIRQANLIGPRK